MEIQTISRRLAPVACAAGLLLAGCGGGGSDGGTASPGFDANNYRTVAEPAAASVLGTIGVTGTLTGSGVTEGALALGAAPRLPDPVALLKQLGAQAAGAREQAQQVESLGPENCPGGGSITGRADVANSNTLTAGDTISITANNCVVSGVTVTGGLDITVRSFSATASSESGTLALTFRNFSGAGGALNGGATLGFNADSTRTQVTLGFSNATIATAGSTATLNYTTTITATASSGTASVSGGLSMNGHDYTLTQPVAFSVTRDGLAPGGTLQVQEALGARVRVVSGTDHFTYQYFGAANSGTTPDATSVSSIAY